jgi:hypothetical protein
MSRFFRVACAALLGLLVSCSEDDVPLTQIVVVVDSDFSGLTRFEADIVGFEEPTTVKANLEDEPLPRRFSLVHDGGALGPMAVTVRAYTDDSDEPILVEPRSDMFFEPGRTLLLKVDLLAACVALDCPEACIAPGKCVSSEDAAVLEPWSGDPDQLGVGGPLDAGMDSGMNMMPDGSMEEAGMTMDSGTDAEPLPDSDVPGDAEIDAAPDTGERDAEIDSGEDAIVPDPTWPYVPSNVDVDEEGPLAGLDRTDIALDCGGDAIINSTDPPSLTGFCDVAPDFTVIDQLGAGGEVLVVVMSSLSIDATSTLKLEGSRPIVLLVEGDATIAGTIDASAQGNVPGPGGSNETVCGASTGITGSPGATSGMTSLGSGGGSGGGFGSAGSLGAASGSGMTVPSVAGGVAAAVDPALSPLRGGCRGGLGGAKSVGVHASPGAGGGAVQLSVADRLSLSGVIHAGGGGGAPGVSSLSGGGGGGSGGAILIEADSISIDAGAVIAANGGAGGGGQSQNTLDSTAGGNGAASASSALGGTGTTTGGDGGRGAALASAATNGGGGTVGGTCGFPVSLNCHYGGGGGGAGGVGRIRIVGATECVVPGTISPVPSVRCASCSSACAEPPDFSCLPRTFDAKLYYVCASEQTWDDARVLCQASSLELATIESAPEDIWLYAESPTNTWIGAYDLDDDDDWHWSAGDVAFWSGDDSGDPVGGAYEGWRSTEPNGTGDCARITADGWADADCDDTLPFICE